LQTGSFKLAKGFLTAGRRRFGQFLAVPFIFLFIKMYLLLLVMDAQRPLSGNSRGCQVVSVEQRRNHTTSTNVRVHKAAKAEQVWLIEH
jgi:hypothetical protein